MTTPNENIKWSYVGDGATTIFSYDNNIFATTDLEVYLDQVLQSAGYSVSIDGDGVGNVTFDVAPGAGVDVVIESVIPALQSTDFVNGEGFDADGAVEDTFDRAMRVAQQTQGALDFTLRLQDGDPATSLGRLPLKTEMANKLLGGDSAGDPIAVEPTDASSTAVTATGSVTARLLANRFAEVINVKNGYGGIAGAAGNGVTDDTAAIQAAIDAWSASMSSTAAENAMTLEKSAILYFPAGLYLVTTTLDFTAIRIQGAAIHCDGWIVAKTSGTPVIDGVDARYLEFYNLKIEAPEEATAPNVGVLLARRNSDNRNSANHLFERPRIQGHFSVACFYNYSSEELRCNDPVFWNYYTTGTPVCMVTANANVNSIASAFQTISTSASETTNGNKYRGVDMRAQNIGYISRLDGVSDLTIEGYCAIAHSINTDQFHRITTESPTNSYGIELPLHHEAPNSTVKCVALWEKTTEPSSLLNLRIEDLGQATALVGFKGSPNPIIGCVLETILASGAAIDYQNPFIFLSASTGTVHRLHIKNYKGSAISGKIDLSGLTTVSGVVETTTLSDIVLPAEADFSLIVQTPQGSLPLSGVATITIASGNLALTSAKHHSNISMVGQGGIADDLDTITGEILLSMHVTLFNRNAYNITIKNAPGTTDGIATKTGADVVLAQHQAMTLFYNGTNSRWHEI